MKELSIQEIHEGTLGILKKIIDICDKVGVNYYTSIRIFNRCSASWGLYSMG